MKNNLRLAVCRCSVLVLMCLMAAPGFIQAQKPDAVDLVSVVVTLSDRVYPDDFVGKGFAKGRIRSQIITALKSKAQETQRPLLAFLKSRGVRDVTPLWLINGLAFSAPENVLQSLSGFPGIESIRPDIQIMATPMMESSAAVPEWNLDLVGAPAMWSQGLTGLGIVVASLDTGVDLNHQDLASRWRGGTNSWYDPNGQHSTPYDTSGHGTQTMGLLVGGSAGGTAIGMAPGAKWIAAKIFNDAGATTISKIHQAYQWVLDPDGNASTDDAADVVNNSWGFEDNVNVCYQEFEQDLQMLKAAGIAVVFSAGNRGPYTYSSVSPANNPSGYAVGAVDATGTLAGFSSRGPSACDGSIYPEVLAPGVGVRTADLTLGGVYPNSYASVTGTSFAAPHVAGAMALLLSANPSATVAELEYALKNTAHDLGIPGGDNDHGFGLIDVAAAGELLDQGSICLDNDGDGFYGQPNCGSLLDCNDYDSRINPAACDIIGDGIDQNCDGVDRRKGKSCPTDGGGGTTPGAEGSGNTCSDGMDNDGDGKVDCADSDCSKNKKCR